MTAMKMLVLFVLKLKRIFTGANTNGTDPEFEKIQTNGR